MTVGGRSRRTNVPVIVLRQYDDLRFIYTAGRSPGNFPAIRRGSIVVRRGGGEPTSHRLDAGGDPTALWLPAQAD